MFLKTIQKTIWQMECEVVPYRVMTVQIAFSHEENENDETEFCIEAWNSEELADLFETFCKENNFKKVTILSISVVRLASTMEELIEMEETA